MSREHKLLPATQWQQAYERAWCRRCDGTPPRTQRIGASTCSPASLSPACSNDKI